MKTANGAGRILGALLLYVVLPAVVLLGAGLFVLVRTQPGLDWLLRQAVASVSSSLDGQLRVQGIRTDGLLRGFALEGVEISDESGRPFVTADSIRVGYALSDILRREIVLVPSEIWGPNVVIERRHGEERSNVARIFGPPDPVSDAGGGADDQSPGWSLELRRTQVHEGSFVLRQPVEDGGVGEGAIFERLEGSWAGAYRVIRFENINARLSSAELLGESLEGQTFGIESLSLEGWIRPQPFQILDLEGDIALGNEGVEVDLARLVLPESEFSGTVDVQWGSEALEFAADLDALHVNLTDFHWLSESIPAASGRLRLTGGGTPESSSWTAENVDLALGSSRVLGRVGVELDSGLRLVDTSLDLAPLHLDDVAAWLDAGELPGQLDGQASLSGPMRDLNVDATLRFSAPDAEIPPFPLAVRGAVDVDGGFAARDLSVRIDTLSYAAVSAFAPDLVVQGTGSLALSATGSLDAGMEISGEIAHGVGDVPSSRISYSGIVQTAGGDEPTVNLALELTPLSLDGLAAGIGGSWPVSGELSGSVLARGPLSDLALAGSFTTPGGPLQAEATLDLGDPLRSYQLEASVTDFALHEVLSAATDPTILTADFALDATGGTLETLAGTGSLVVRSSRYGSAEIDSATARFRASGGRLMIEDLTVDAPFLRVDGSGDLALREDEPDGLVSLVWAIDSLSTLRPIVLGEARIAADTLTQLERDILLLDGIDPDTLVDSDVTPLAGRAVGEVTLRGAVDDFEADGYAEIVDAVYAANAVRRARVDASGAWSADGVWAAEAAVGFDSLSLGGFRLPTGEATAAFGADGTGAFDFTAAGPEAVVYEAAGTLTADSVRTRVAFESLAVTDSANTWRLAEPAIAELRGRAVQVEGLRLVGDLPGQGGSRPYIRVEGVLDRAGLSDLALETRDVGIRQLGSLFQAEGLPGGAVDIDFVLRGPAESPEFEGDLVVRDFVLDGSSISLLEGTVAYRDEVLDGRLVGSRGEQRLLELDGTVPADLSLVAVEERFPNRDMDLGISVDSLPASTVLGVVDAFQNVQGFLDGEVRLRGAREDLRPSGQITLQGGAFTIPGIGLDVRSAQADFSVQEDFGVVVDAELQAAGRARVEGTVSLRDLLDPGFDLRISASGFQAVSRRDLTARVGAEVTLTGSYEAPQVQGAVAVEQGELFLEEFIRGADVIDLTDPRFIDVVDTTLVAGAPGASQNPFLNNLRVDVDLSLDRDFWIRSRGNLQGLDVELAGPLTVNFDRPARELVMVGTLQAVRGSYYQFGRQFEVESGTLEFPGIPGINPSLNIQAEYRLRRQEAERLDIVANVGGTLQSPEVTLSSDAQPPLPESDLISYLLFGQPAYALQNTDAALVDLAVNTGLGGLGSSVGQSLGVDYLSISRSQSFDNLSAVTSTASWSEQFADTQIEAGRYLGEDVFIAITVRPLTGLGGPVRRAQLPGASIEWNLNDYWSIEAFFEDQLRRQTAAGLADLDEGRATFGFSLFREWGY